MTKMYCIPRLDGTGSCPVWSMYIVPVGSIANIVAKQMWVLSPLVRAGGKVSNGSVVGGLVDGGCGDLGFVLLVPCLIWSMWPLVVALDWGGWRRRLLEVRPGKLVM